ncbi:MAG: hypothetical protein ACRDNS_34455 [Trebonia sp.]
MEAAKALVRWSGSGGVISSRHPTSCDRAAPDPRLADLIADRLTVKLGIRLIGGTAAPESGPQSLWTAHHVATRYGVSLGFVYQHADELGCVRLGGGTCPRLRFDPAAVQARWAQVGAALPVERPQRRRSRRRRRPATHRHDEDLLLEFEREP